jgi:hypothetical protein
VLLLQPSELVEPPPCPSLKALGVTRAILLGQELQFILDWFKREPTLIREQCARTGMTPLGAVLLTPALSPPEKLVIVESLLEDGADLGVRDWLGKCALRIAYMHSESPGGVEVLALLLKRGARPKPYYHNGSQLTLLSAAVFNDEDEVLRLLLEWHSKSGLFTAAELDQALGGAELTENNTAAELLIQSSAKMEPPVSEESSECEPGVELPVGRPYALWRCIYKVRPRVQRRAPKGVSRSGPLTASSGVVGALYNVRPVAALHLPGTPPVRQRWV